MVDNHSDGLVPFQSILHLTDFSACSDLAFTWAVSLACANQAKFSLLHVVIADALTYMTPGPKAILDLQEKWAQEQMQRVAAHLKDLPHEMVIERGRDVWSVVEARLGELGSDLIVLGTHGRRGLRKMVMGSVAERVLRSSAVPVLTVGPEVPLRLKVAGKFRRVLLATDFTAGSTGAAYYATSVAQRDDAELVLVHACRKGKQGRSEKCQELSVAEIMHRLHETIPHEEQLRHRPEAIVEYGKPEERIVEVARRREADLIVMGIRNTRNLFAATHLEIGTAHSVVIQAPCPVLTVRPKELQAA
jgi:nucleotide-binding universal stress UspA family protein